MSWQDVTREVIAAATAELADVDLTSRCALLGLPAPHEGIVEFRAFGKNMVLHASGLKLESRNSRIRDDERALVLHYLLCKKEFSPGGDPVSFRQFPGGQFYLQPFLSRTARPILTSIGNDLERLRENLKRVDWEPVQLGDLGARIHAIGKIYVTLVYRTGDKEFEPSLDVLFDPCAKVVFTADDAAAVASRICLALV